MGFCEILVLNQNSLTTPLFCNISQNKDVVV